jgi:predicted amidohydrolase YtcJ
MLVLANAHVLTMDPHRPRAGMVAVADGRVVALDGPVPADAHVLDGRGGVLLPGFVDPHVHLLAAAAALRSVDCSPRAVRSITEIQHALAAAARLLAPGAWLRARGYDESALAEGRHPTRWDLDAAVPDRPVRLLHRSGHAVVLNSAALAVAGINTATEEPPGGTIERRLDDGEPTGLLIDMEAAVERVTPPLPFEDLVAGMRAFSASLLQAGVTAVQDMTHRNDAERLALLERVCAAAGFRPRLCPPATAPGVPGLGPVKLMLHEAGAIDAAQRAAVIAAAIAAHRAGRQLAVHTVTEAGVELALDAVEAALDREPRPGHRHRIEHAALCPPEMARRAAALGVIVVSNPAFLYDGGDRYLRHIPADNLPHLYAVGALLRAGVAVAAASDAPVTAPSPLTSLRAAMDRRSRTGARIPGVPAGLADALTIVTRAAAFCAFSEQLAGTIAPGMPADLVLLSGLPAPNAPDPAVWWTIRAGEVLYVSPEAPAPE